MDLQESVTQEDATCFAMCSSATCSSASGCRVGDEGTISSTNTKDCEAEGTGTVSSVVTLMYHCHVRVWGVAILVFHISP